MSPSKIVVTQADTSPVFAKFLLYVVCGAPPFRRVDTGAFENDSVHVFFS